MMQPKKKDLEKFRANEKLYAEASVEFTKAYLHVQCAITSAVRVYDIFKSQGINKGEVKQAFGVLMKDMDMLAANIKKNFGEDTKNLLLKCYDDIQRDINNETENYLSQTK